MIASLSGVIDYVTTSFTVINVSGVGYKVALPQSILSTLATGQDLTVYTYTHVREDLLDLYGFLDRRDLGLFEMLLSVSGIGPKTALGVFANGTREEIVNAILKSDTAFFSGVPRLGKKNAQKIIIELKSKLGGDGLLEEVAGGSEHEEVVSALQALGYSAKEAGSAYRSVSGDGLSAEEMIRLALKYLGK